MCLLPNATHVLAYLHEKVKPGSEDKPNAKAEPKPKPKDNAKACSPAEGCLEFAADTGAGRHLVSSQALERQGIHHEMFDRFMVPSSEGLRFTTGGGNRDSSDAIVERQRRSLQGSESFRVGVLSICSFGGS